MAKHIPGQSDDRSAEPAGRRQPARRADRVFGEVHALPRGLIEKAKAAVKN
jgi:hypothetical protein